MFFSASIFVLALALTAFFSGSETGFYRVARVRLVIDSLGGSSVAKGLLWATNHPVWFVATTLIGVNVAHELLSYAGLSFVEQTFPDSELAEWLSPLIITPIAFIYGDLLPKSLFLQAPYRLLRKCWFGLLAAGILFAPISLLLSLVRRVIDLFVKSPTPMVRMALARRELTQMFSEGSAVGLLSPTQQKLAQATLESAGRAIREFAVPIGRHLTVPANAKRWDVVRLARQARLDVLPVEATPRGAYLGCVRAAICLLSPSDEQLPLTPLAEFRDSESFLNVLVRMQSTSAPLALIRSTSGAAIGFVALANLQRALLADATK